MTIDLDALEALYISRKFTLGSVPDTVLELIAALRETQDKLNRCAHERRWLAEYMSAYAGPDWRLSPYEYLGMAKKYAKAEEK